MSDRVYTASDLVVLTLEEAVRKRPGMYVGSTGPMGVAHLVFGLVGEALKRHHLAGATRVDVATAPLLTVTDNGEPPSDEEVGAWTRWPKPAKDPELHDSDEWIGYPVAIPLSSVFVATLDGERRRQQVWAQGRVVSPLVDVGPGVGRGTCVALTPDAGIFAGAPLPLRVVRTRFEELAVLHPAVTLTLDGDVLPSHGGVAGFARWLAGDCVERTVHRLESSEGVTVEVAVVWGASHGPPTERSWVNGLQAEGEHLDGLRDALDGTVREGRVAVLRMVLPFAEYAGRTRRQLTTNGVRSRVAEVVRRALTEADVMEAR
jgi:DNA gyrase subunit B